MSGKGQRPSRDESGYVDKASRSAVLQEECEAVSIAFLKGSAESRMTARRQREIEGEAEYAQRGLPGKGLCFILSLPFFRLSQKIVCLGF